MTGALEFQDLGVDVFELRVTVGMRAAFLGLAIDLPTKTQLFQQSGDAALVDYVAHGHEA